MHEENTGKQVRVFGELVRSNNSVPVVSADGVYDYNQTDEHGNKKTQEQLNDEFKTAIEKGVTISTTERQTSVKLVEDTEFRIEAGTGVKVGKWGEVDNSIQISADTDVLATKTDLTAKYEKPSGGIPKEDLSSDVQASLNKADTALQNHQDISGKADKADTYTKAQTYNKDEVDAAIEAIDVSEQLEDVAFLGDDGGQAVIPEFDPQTDTLLKTTQSLTNTEKETVIGNILDKNYIAGSYVGKGKKYLKLNVGAPVATDFDGFVDGATTEQSSLAEVPNNVYFDRTNNMFIASKGEGLLTKYYMSWQDGDAYMNPNSGVYFKNGDNYYQWNGTTLEAATVGNVNKLTQADFDSENTIYVIRYDFDLCGQSITIPGGCVLEFDGGSLKNGTITLQGAKVIPNFNTIATQINLTIIGMPGVGEFYFQEGKPSWSDGTKWVDEKGYTAAKSKGTTAQRPTADLTSGDAGFEYFDTTLDKTIYWNGTAWVDETGVIAGTPTSGTYANKPTVSANSIPVGFKYFCTDKQTTEGATDGIEIIHKGNDVWVDALGRTIS